MPVKKLRTLSMSGVQEYFAAVIKRNNSMSNAVILPFEADMELVITADNSGSIGEKEADVIKTSNKIVGQFACRVALMECLAEYGEPQAVVMQNFTDEGAWLDYKAGVLEILEEAGYYDL